jgi:hypothetical protein
VNQYRNRKGPASAGSFFYGLTVGYCYRCAAAICTTCPSRAMIQRLQTVYLLLAALFLGILFLAEGAWTGTATSLYSWYVPVSMGLFGLAAAGAVTAVFLYKGRKRQRSLVVAMQIVVLLGLLLKVVLNSMAGGFASISTDATFEYWVGYGAPVMAYLMLLMARRGIDRDTALIKSMDRLR